MKKLLILISLILVSIFTLKDTHADLCSESKYGDPDYIPQVKQPAFSDLNGKKPMVVIDQAHNNYHTLNGRYKTFAELLTKDGYDVKSSIGKYTRFSKKALIDIDILVIANALNSKNVDMKSCSGKWQLPTSSAFDDEEIQVLRTWVEQGGSLLLIADHMPFAGASEKLANAFGFNIVNGYTIPENKSFTIEFQQQDGSLKNHPIIFGRNGKLEKVDSVTTFMGHAFWIKSHSKARPLMILREGTRTILPYDANVLPKPTDKELSIANISSAGQFQGATLKAGKGRMAMFAEASMFTSQKNGEMKSGMNNPSAVGNKQFTLNVLHWLSGLLPDENLQP